MRNTLFQPLLFLSFLSSGSLLAQQSQEELQSAAQTIVQKSCAAGSCHNQFVSPQLSTADGAVDWTMIKNQADRILTRVQDGSMPPNWAPAAQQISATERQTLLRFVKTQLPSAPNNGGLPINSLNVPAGFAVEVFAKAEGARSLAVTDDGIVFVGTGGFSNVDPKGRVHAIVPTANGRKVMALAWNLDNPNGVALKGKDLYVAELTRVLKFPNAVDFVKANINKDLGERSAPYTVIRDGLPEAPTHSWKYLGFGPDGKLYVNIGAPCNICLPDRDLFASIFRMNDDGSNFELVARGVRNTVGFTWHPSTQELWFTDNGRDQLGDDIPADELNRLSVDGQDFGYPFCHAKTISDPSFGRNQNCMGPEFTKPEVELGAHVAALGLSFYTGSQFPAAYKNAIFIAEHGSWNRQRKNGYRLSVVQFTSDANGQTVARYRPFIAGWLRDAQQTNWGRPVDVKNYRDGSLLLSDDQAGVVYRISYSAP